MITAAFTERRRRSVSSQYTGHLCVPCILLAHVSADTGASRHKVEEGARIPQKVNPPPGEMFAHAGPTSNGIAVPPQIMNHNGRLRALRVVALSKRPSWPSILLADGRKGTRRVRDYTVRREERAARKKGRRTRQLELK